VVDEAAVHHHLLARDRRDRALDRAHRPGSVGVEQLDRVDPAVGHDPVQNSSAELPWPRWNITEGVIVVIGASP
jgi:hypothetical protein